MKIDFLIKKLKELKKEHGNLEVILWTQRDAWSYDMHKIDMIYQDNKDNLIVIQGKEKTGDKE
jgi:hypothetical protein